MSERINTPFTNEHFVAFVKKMVGHPYWYGTCLYPCTESTLKSKAKKYPEHYSSSRMAQYRLDIANKDVASDCVGGCKGYAWTNGGIGVLEAIGTGKSYSRKNGSNRCPDKSANGMFEYAKKKGMDWGVISTIPEIIGLAVRKDGHVGYYIGNGEVVEWMGFSYGCRKTKLKSRPWTHWYKLPFIDYNDGAAAAPVQEMAEYVLGSRQLVKGATGSDVKAMQELLMQLGYKLPDYGADGDFGEETLAALIAFQNDHSVKADGKYGEETHKALMDAVADDDEGKKAATPEVPAFEEPIATTGPQVEIVASQGGKVNIRVGNSTAYARITTVAAGTRLPYIATAENGWMAVVVGAQIGWVSPKYSRRI